MALSPSERIWLVKEIARSMHDQDWGNAELILREFALPHTRDDANSNDRDYIVSVLRSGTDHQLIAMADHYGLDFVASKSTIDPTCWPSGYMRLFVSHLAKYKQEAADLKAELNGYGISAFVAHNDIEPTIGWQDEIEKALATCDALVVLMREGFHASKWTDQEIGYAMGRDRLIISVRLGQDPYGFIGRFQAINGTSLTCPALADQIFGILKKNNKTRDRIANGLVASFVVSDSFAEARKRTTLLARAEYWDRTLSDRCLTALKRNRQIYAASGVPDQLANIIKAHEQKYG